MEMYLVFCRGMEAVNTEPSDRSNNPSREDMVNLYWVRLKKGQVKSSKTQPSPREETALFYLFSWRLKWIFSPRRMDSSPRRKTWNKLRGKMRSADTNFIVRRTQDD
ncbi:hypothetical protein RUM43_010014 [Polyplax serrata]|uniref:Uncharacterized protein n=1 Tax=Polyplax serrata TaxID=468196 RepID=A0AAN8S4L4_POLSC